jgi:hypothetical protein
MRSVRLLSAALVLCFAAWAVSASRAEAQALFRDDAPLTLTLTTNLRDLVRERDSTELRWFGAEMSYADAKGTTRRVPVELRARGHFRRQARNCAFPPLYLRADRTETTTSSTSTSSTSRIARTRSSIRCIIARGSPRSRTATPRTA